MMNAATPIAVSANAAAFSGNCTLRGASIRDTSGVTNTVKIYDNTSASGTILLSVQLAGNASIPPLAIDGGLRAQTGLYVSATGAIEGSVWVG